MCTSFWFPEVHNGRADYIPAAAKSDYCRALQSCPKGLAMCVRDDRGCIMNATPAVKPVIHTCFAGLTAVAVPVSFQGRVRGMIFAGDVLASEPSRASFSRIRRRIGALDIDFDELESVYRRIPVVPRNRIRIAAELLSLIVNYIVDRQQNASLQKTIYRLQGEIYARQKDLLSSLSERSELEKSLRQNMDTVRKLRKALLAQMRVEKAAVLTDDDMTRRRRIVRRAMSFVDASCSENIRLAEAAQYVGLSPSYLSQIFHKEACCTFKQYLTRRRVEKACELLADMRLNVTEVSMRAGYDNVNYFGEVFKRLIGMSPGDYRDRVLPEADRPRSGLA
jgi:AraC-like DNA-binding protein/ligand-binding sensor protein